LRITGGKDRTGCATSTGSVSKGRTTTNTYRRQGSLHDSVLCAAEYRLAGIVRTQTRRDQEHALRRCLACLPANAHSILGRKRLEWFCVYKRRDRDLATHVGPTWATWNPYDLRQTGTSRKNHEAERERAHRDYPRAVRWNLRGLEGKLRTRCDEVLD